MIQAITLAAAALFWVLIMTVGVWLDDPDWRPR